MRSAIDSACPSCVLDTESVAEWVTSGSRVTKRKGVADFGIEVEHLITVRIASMVSSLISYASFEGSIRSGVRENFSAFLSRDIPT